MIEQIFKLVGAELFCAHQKEEDARVEVSGARIHRDAAGRGKTHGGVDRHSIANSAEARSITEVREDGSFRKLRAEMMHERLIGKTVETVSSNARLEVALRKRKMRCDLRHGAVKRIVEAGEMCRRRKDRLRGSNKRQRLRDVQRREVCGVAQPIQNLRRDELVLEEIGSAMHYAMANRQWSSVHMFPNCCSESG